ISQCTMTCVTHLLTLLLAAAIVQQGTCITCYYCSNDPDTHPYPYDASCADPDYASTDKLYIVESSISKNCYTGIFNDGVVTRGVVSGQFDACEYYSSRIYCNCTHDFCNTSMCPQCNSTSPIV
ncbi:unnamed protein product, partial [Meganyctiphanes norvegica]